MEHIYEKFWTGVFFFIFHFYGPFVQAINKFFRGSNFVDEKELFFKIIFILASELILN